MEGCEKSILDNHMLTVIVQADLLKVDIPDFFVVRNVGGGGLCPQSLYPILASYHIPIQC